MKKLKFYVTYAVPYDPHSGGLVALHKLVHNLTVLGEEAYINSPQKNPDFLGNVYAGDGSDVDVNNSIGLYPEVVHDNPLNFKYVVRWLLYERGVVYPKSDWLYTYWSYFKPHNENKSQLKGLLSAFHVDRSVFYDKGQHQVGKYCYVVRKGANKKLNAHPPDAVQLDDYVVKGGNTYLSQVFNECEYFVSYDDATFLTTQAALCGCTPVVVPNEGVPESTWKNCVDLHKYGHAYGFGDVEHARQTRQQLLEVVENLEYNSLQQTKQFVEDCYRSVYGS